MRTRSRIPFETLGGSVLSTGVRSSLMEHDRLWPVLTLLGFHDEQEGSMSLSSLVSRHTQRYHASLLLVCLFVLLLGGCSSTAPTASTARCSTTTELSGEGSTFDAVVCPI